MMNNYKKILFMETVLVSVLPEGARPWEPDREEREESVPVVVEEIKGRIYPKTEEESSHLVGSSAGGEKGEEIIKMEPAPEESSAEAADTLKQQEPEQQEAAQQKPEVSESGSQEPETSETQAQEIESQASEEQSLQETEEAAAPVTDKKPGGIYAVGEGETLYGICFKLYGNVNHVKDICALNGMKDMNHVTAGQRLILPADVPIAEEMKDLVEE